MPRDNGAVMHTLAAIWHPVTGLDQPDHPFGMGPTFLVLCLFFIVVFVVVAYIGDRRMKKRGPQAPPTYPILGDKPKKKDH